MNPNNGSIYVIKKNKTLKRISEMCEDAIR